MCVIILSDIFSCVEVSLRSNTMEMPIEIQFMTGAFQIYQGKNAFHTRWNKMKSKFTLLLSLLCNTY